jgi:hypothetical protein
MQSKTRRIRNTDDTDAGAGREWAGGRVVLGVKRAEMKRAVRHKPGRADGGSDKRYLQIWSAA